MEEIMQKFETQKKTIEENMDFIISNLRRMDGPIFIELMGTPKSGKTTLVKHLQALFSKRGVALDKRRETAEYNPIDNKGIEEYNVWMIMELMKNLSEDISNTDPRIVLYDRGMLDRIPWIETSVRDGSFPAKDAEIIKRLYDSEFMEKYKPLSYGFVTSPEISVLRKGKEGRLVNRKTIGEFNDSFAKSVPYISDKSGRYSQVITDSYQGNLNGFIMDMAEKVTGDVREVMQDRLTKRKKEAPDFDEK